MEEGKTKKGGRNRRRRKEERRKEESEEEGGGKSKVKPVTEWAGMTDWVVAVKKWMLGSGEEDKRWEVTKNRVGRNDRLGSGNGEKRGERRKKERERRLSKTEWAGMTDWVMAVLEKQRQERGSQGPSGPEGPTGSRLWMILKVVIFF